MRKFIRFGLAALAAVVLLAATASAFNDIVDAEQKKAAESLKSLGIMEGVAADAFSPDDYLTRAQFCKIAVLSMGLEDVQSYKNYTLFPDLKHTHWAAQYVNAAVKKYGIIQGFPDGTFRPDDTLTYGQAVTMLIHMLGYEIADVGPFWPDDYVEKSADIGLSKGLALSAGDRVTRGQAAILARNLLLADTKEKGVFIENSYANVTAGAILVATSRNDSSLKSNEAKFYAGDETVVYKLASELSQGIVGAKGYLVFNKGATEVRGFVPDADSVKTAVVQKSRADKLETSIGEITVPKKAKVVAGGNIRDYEDGWMDIIADSNISIYYDKFGMVELISSESAGVGKNTFIYGYGSALYIPTNAKVIKNGEPAAVSDIKKFDVVSIDYDANTVTVTDKKIKGNYEEGSPSYSYPSKVKVLNREFAISESAAEYFKKDIEIGKEIVLMLDSSWNVVAAAPGSAVSFEQLGVLEKLTDASATVKLLNGLTIECPANLWGGGTFDDNGSQIPSYYKREGQLVRVGQGTNKMLTFGSVSYKPSSNAWNIEGAKIGPMDVSPKAKVYEQVSEGAPLREIEVDDIPTPTVGALDIRHIVTDHAGRAQTIIVGDVTGDGYYYGIIKGGSETIVEEVEVPDPSDPTKTIIERNTTNKWAAHLLTLDGEMSYTPAIAPSVGNMSPSGVPKGMEDLKYISRLPIVTLKSAGTVDRDAFDTTKGVNVRGSYIKVSDEVQVYSRSLERFVTFSEARANNDSFEIYIDKETHAGGKVRVIIVK